MNKPEREIIFKYVRYGIPKKDDYFIIRDGDSFKSGVYCASVDFHQKYHIYKKEVRNENNKENTKEN